MTTITLYCERFKRLDGSFVTVEEWEKMSDETRGAVLADQIADEYEVTVVGSYKHCPAKLTGHPDTWHPDESSEEIESATCAGAPFALTADEEDSALGKIREAVLESDDDPDDYEPDDYYDGADGDAAADAYFGR